MQGQSALYKGGAILIGFLCCIGLIGPSHTQDNAPTCQIIISYANSAMGGNLQAQNALRKFADKGDSLAQVVLSSILSIENFDFQLETVGAFSKYSEPLHYAEESTEEGSSLGQVMYGFMSLMMVDHGYPFDPFVSKKSMITLGYRYLKKGIPGIERNLQGPCAPPYLDALGTLSIYGLGVPYNTKFALQLYLRSARTGYVPAIGNVGELYAWRQGPFYDQTKAVEWTMRAARDGYLPAITLLGVFYTYGNGVKKSYTRAFELYKLAANRGYPPAKYYLSLAYFDGHGTPVRRKKAISLMAQAIMYRPALRSFGNEMIYARYSTLPLKQPAFTGSFERRRKLVASFLRFEKKNELKPINLPGVN